MTEAEREENRRKIKKHPVKPKKKKHTRKWLIVLAIIVILIGVGVFGFRIKNLQITGNERVSDETIQSLIQYDKCQNNALLLWVMNRKVDLSSEPLLNAIHIRIKNPQTVIVQVNEEKLAGYIVSDGTYLFVNDSGKIVLKQSDKISGVLLLDGITADGSEVGEQLVSEDTGIFSDFLDISKILRSNEISADSLSLTTGIGYCVTLGKVRVLLGKDIYMEEKISELNDLIPKLEGLSGTLHLEEYDSTKDSIIFTKDS